MTAAFLTLSARTFASVREHRNYRLFFIGQSVSVCGTWMADTALPWLIVQRTHSAVAVGLLLFCRYVPFAVFGLHAGVFADRYDNRRMLMVTQASSMLVASTLAILTLIVGVAPIWAIFLLAILGGIAVVFDNPCRTALTFQLVGREQLPNAVSLNAGLNNAARVVGPATAGIVIALTGVGVCFAINAVTFLAVLTVFLLMRANELIPLARADTPPKGIAAIREGIAYVRTDPVLKLVIIISAVIGIAGFNIRTLLPILAAKTLAAGADTFGALYACFGVGALTGALFAAGASAPTLKRLLLGVGSFSAFLLLIAPLRSAWLVGILLIGVGIGFSLWSSASQSMLQLNAPDHLRGRVVSLWIFVFAGFAPIGSLLAGWLAAVGGTELAFVVSGGFGLAAATVGFSQMRHRTALRSDRTNSALLPAITDVPPLE